MNVDKMKNRLSTFPTLKSLMEDSIYQIYYEDKKIEGGYGLGWALRDSLKDRKDWGTTYLDSLELNLCSIVGRIDRNKLNSFKKRLINEFWETFSEIQTLGAIYRAGNDVELEESLPDAHSIRTFDFKMIRPEIFLEIYTPFSKELEEECDYPPRYVDSGEELRKKIFNKYKKKHLKNITSIYPVFLVVNTLRLDIDLIQISEIINPKSDKYVFPKNVHCNGIFLYKYKSDIDGITLKPTLLFNPNCSEELKEELTMIINEFR